MLTRAGKGRGRGVVQPMGVERPEHSTLTQPVWNHPNKGVRGVQQRQPRESSRNTHSCTIGPVRHFYHSSRRELTTTTTAGPRSLHYFRLSNTANYDFVAAILGELNYWSITDDGSRLLVITDGHTQALNEKLYLSYR